MLIVTGGIACGKSTFLEVARMLGYDCVDADDWYNNTFKDSERCKNSARIMFEGMSIKDAAFTHPRWGEFTQLVNICFMEWLNEWSKFIDAPQIVAIPDIFQRGGFPLGNKILTIERPYNLDAAMKRDGHRNPELTLKIHQHQMDPGKRMKLADFVLHNTGTKEQFEQECETWLRQHLPAVSTQPTTDTSTS